MTNQPAPTYENFQIHRADGKSKFVESLSRSFEIGKVILNFVEYDDKRKAGDRIVNQISIYMDFSKFRVFAQDMISGRYAALAKTTKGSLYQDLTGTSAQRLAQQDRAREDGKSESRKFSIAGSAKGFFFTAESGPGETSDTGLIKPAGRTEKKVSIPLAIEDAKAIVLTTLAAMDAYETAKQTTKQMEVMLKANNLIK